MAYDRSSAWGFGSAPGHMMERSARRQDAFARGRYGMDAPAFANMASFKRKQRDDNMEETTTSVHTGEKRASGRRVLLRGLKRMRLSGSPPTSPQENDSSSGASSEDDIEMMDQVSNSAQSQAERAKALVLAQRRPAVIVKPQQQTTTSAWPPAQYFAAGNAVNMGPIPDDASCRAMVVFDPRHSIAPSPRIELVPSDDEDEARSSDDEAPFVRFEEIHEDEDMAMDVD